jgi:hypothetical protein
MRCRPNQLLAAGLITVIGLAAALDRGAIALSQPVTISRAASDRVAPAGQEVTRSGKSDRLPVAGVAVPRKKTPPKSPATRLPVGCERSVSSIIKQVPGDQPARCVTGFGAANEFA